MEVVLREVIEHGEKYKQYNYSDGSVVLERYDEINEMWIISRFSNKDDTEVVNNIIETAINVL